MSEENKKMDPNILIRENDLAGSYANFAAVTHTPFEFTIDFARLDFNQMPPTGIIVQRINLSPLFVSQLIDALQANWDSYAAKSLPKDLK